MASIAIEYGSLAITAVLALTASVLVFAMAMTAVWSRKPFRRRAAADILRQILDFLRPAHK